MVKNGATIFIDNVKQALSVATDADLATRLRVGKSTISSWRMRDYIPEKKRKEIENISGVSFNEIDKRWASDETIIMTISQIVYHRAAAVAFNTASPHDLNKIVAHLVANNRDLYHKIILRIQDVVEGRKFTEDDILSLAQQAYAGKFMSAAELTGVVRVEEGSSKGSSK